MKKIKPDIEINEDKCMQIIEILNKQREYEKQLQCAIQITSLGVWSWDLTNNFISLSNEVFDLIGHSKESFNNSIDYIINYILHPDSRIEFQNAMEMDLKKGHINTRFFKLISTNDKECWVKVNGQLIFDENGNQVKLLGTILDVTDDHIIKRNLESNLSFLQSLVDALPNPIFYKDNTGLYRYCNTAFLDYLGYEKEDIINRSVYHIAPKELADVYHQADLNLMESKSHQVYEARVRYADGTLRDVLFSKATHLDLDGEVLGLVGIMQDVTKQNTMMKQVDMLHKVKDVLLEINQSIMTYENELEFIKEILRKLKYIYEHCMETAVLNYDSPTSLSVLKLDDSSKDDIRIKIALNQEAIQFNKSYSIDYAHIINDLEKYNDLYYKELMHTKNKSLLAIPIKVDDQLKWILTFASDKNNVFSDNDLAVANYIREELPIIFNVFNLYQRTLLLSRHDPLTGLMNRGYFDTVIADRLAIADRMNHNVVIALFDLDKLKFVNDEYGHSSGDMYIEKFTALLKQYFRKSDAFARIGGDEFVGIFANTDPGIVSSKIESLRATFDMLKFELYGNTFSGSFSFGLAHYPSDYKDITNLLKLADENMYNDKQRYK